ncbi:hypothetical protein QTP88_025413 [Uroleucon formosanum]
MKKTFLKCPKRIAILNEKCPDIPNPPKPITTRWGTWIIAAEYYCTYLNEIKSAVEEFSENAQCVNVVKELIKDQSLHSNLVYITTNFQIYTTCNYTIRKRGETLAKSIGIVLEAKQKLKETNGEVVKLILEKCNRVFKKNNGWADFQKVNNIHNGTAVNVNVEQYDSDDLVYMIYAPITSVDVERSFSIIKLINAFFGYVKCFFKDLFCYKIRALVMTEDKNVLF